VLRGVKQLIKAFKRSLLVLSNQLQMYQIVNGSAAFSSTCLALSPRLDLSQSAPKMTYVCLRGSVLTRELAFAFGKWHKADLKYHIITGSTGWVSFDDAHSRKERLYLSFDFGSLTVFEFAAILSIIPPSPRSIFEISLSQLRTSA
jgi:hypothetical protein